MEKVLKEIKFLLKEILIPLLSVVLSIVSRINKK